MRMNDLAAALRGACPELKGELEAEAPLAPISWFRTGGAAEVLFTPADLGDLQLFLQTLKQLSGSRNIPILTIGLGSNLLVRDGGVEGVVIRLGEAFMRVAEEPGERLRAGAGAPDMKMALGAAKFSLAGLSFFRGIPGTIGGALRMNAGAYGGETKDVLSAAEGLLADGTVRQVTAADMGGRK